MNKSKSGFTIVELLIVIVIIGILAAITVVAYNGITSRSRTAKIQSDLSNIEKAVIAGRVLKGGTMNDIVQNTYVAGPCATKPTGTDLASLPKTDACWTNYISALQKLTDASGVNVNGIVDPLGRPYFIDANEGEASYLAGCAKDQLASFSDPFNGSSRVNMIQISLVTTTC